MVGKTPKTMQFIPCNFQTQPGGHCLTACPPFGNQKKKHRQRLGLLDISQAVTAQGAPRTFEKIIPFFQVPLLLKFGKDTPKKCSHNNSVKNWTTTPIHPPSHVLAGCPPRQKSGDNVLLLRYG